MRLADASRNFFRKAQHSLTHPPGQTKLDPYHFINFPKDTNTYNQQRDCKLRNCVIEAIAWYVQVLKSADAPRNEKRTALRFVAYLVGEIHQPLHAGFAEDSRRQQH